MKRLWLLSLLGLALAACQKPVELGTIKINSTPEGAEVILDDSTTGKKTDCVLEDVALGHHDVRLILEGYEPWTREIEITEDDPDYEINADLTEISNTGAIQITSDPPGAFISLDGDSTGYTTDTLLEGIATGDHFILLTLGGYQDWQDTATVPADDTVFVDASLEFAGKVTGLAAEGTTNGEGVHLTWNPVLHAETYNVYFEGILLVEEITVTEYTDLYPAATGDYTVSASAGGEEGPESEPLSTRPSAVQELELYELNGAEPGGLGWEPSTGTASVYSMADETCKKRIDCYFTDYALGTTGTYMLSSASEIGFDPGNTWMPGTEGWRLSGISDPLGENLEDVTLAPEFPYYNYSEVTVGEAFALWTEEEHYALIEVTGIDKMTGRVQIKTTFQTIEGLRLFN